jgi:hypothetical protein
MDGWRGWVKGEGNYGHPCLEKGWDDLNQARVREQGEWKIRNSDFKL